MRRPQQKFSWPRRPCRCRSRRARHVPSRRLGHRRLSTISTMSFSLLKPPPSPLLPSYSPSSRRILTSVDGRAFRREHRGEGHPEKFATSRGQEARRADTHSRDSRALVVCRRMHARSNNTEMPRRTRVHAVLRMLRMEPRASSPPFFLSFLHAGAPVAPLAFWNDRLMLGAAAPLVDSLC